MKTITFLGSKTDSHYHGYDDDDVVTIPAGEDAEVSDAKAAQVAADFPHLFLVDGKTPPKPKQQPAAATDEPVSGDDDPNAGGGGEDADEDKAALLALPNADLEARATKLGIEDVGKKGLKTKAELADAILAKLAEDTGGDET